MQSFKLHDGTLQSVHIQRETRFTFIKRLSAILCVVALGATISTLALLAIVAESKRQEAVAFDQCVERFFESNMTIECIR